MRTAAGRIALAWRAKARGARDPLTAHPKVASRIKPWLDRLDSADERRGVAAAVALAIASPRDVPRDASQGPGQPRNIQRRVAVGVLAALYEPSDFSIGRFFLNDNRRPEAESEALSLTFQGYRLRDRKRSEELRKAEQICEKCWPRFLQAAGRHVFRELGFKPPTRKRRLDRAGQLRGHGAPYFRDRATDNPWSHRDRWISEVLGAAGVVISPATVRGYVRDIAGSDAGSVIDLAVKELLGGGLPSPEPEYPLH